MAADLVENPTIPQTFIHDLESTFWVLLWVVLSYMKTSWNDATRSSVLKDTMSPRIYHSSNGATGGRNKMNFLTAPFSLSDLKIDNNKPLLSLLAAMKYCLSARYTPKESVSNDLVETNDTSEERLKDTLGRLKDHTFILSLFSTILSSDDWPDDDPSQRQPLLVSREVETRMQSGSKRSRSKAEENGVFIHPPAAKQT
jgi:hypothetical protein